MILLRFLLFPFLTFFFFFFLDGLAQESLELAEALGRAMGGGNGEERGRGEKRRKREALEAERENGGV